MNLPEGWNKITLRQFNQIDSILKDKELDEIDREIEILCALTGFAPDFFESLQLNEFKTYIEKTAFLKTDPDSKIKKRFKVGNTYYKAIFEMNKLTAGQYIDLMTYVKDPAKINDNAHHIMATISVPLKKTWYGFKELPYKEGGGDKFLDVTMDVVFPMTVFFCEYWKNLMPVIEGYLEGIKIQNRESLINTSTDGAGS